MGAGAGMCGGSMHRLPRLLPVPAFPLHQKLQLAVDDPKVVDLEHVILSCLIHVLFIPVR